MIPNLDPPAIRHPIRTRAYRAGNPGASRPADPDGNRVGFVSRICRRRSRVLQWYNGPDRAGPLPPSPDQIRVRAHGTAPSDRPQGCRSRPRPGRHRGGAGIGAEAYQGRGRPGRPEAHPRTAPRPGYNTDGPVHLDKLRGKVVLLDFWTFCCVNCHHVLPELARLEQKYKNQLVVVGIHTAKFDAEKVTENIRSKVREYGIKHPVANDANQVIMDRFRPLTPDGRMSWPTFVLIDASGKFARLYKGEGGTPRRSTPRSQARRQGPVAGASWTRPPSSSPAEVDKPHDGALLYPGKVTADAASKRLYISDTGHNRIVVTGLDGKLVETIGSGKEGLVDGPFATASFSRPQGTCLFEGILYVADTENHALRAVDLKAKQVTDRRRDRQAIALLQRSRARGATTLLNSPWDVLPIPGTRSLAIAMAGPAPDLAIRRRPGARDELGLARAGRISSTDRSPRPSSPSRAAWPPDGQHLFVADSEVSGLRSISLGAQHRVATIAGTGLFAFGDVDGKGESVRLQHCLGLTFGDGKLYVADSYNNKVKVCDPKTRTVKTLSGDGKRGSTDSPPEFSEPGGLSLAGSDLYVADTNNHLIRVIDLNTQAVRDPRARRRPGAGEGADPEVPPRDR